MSVPIRHGRKRRRAPVAPVLLGVATGIVLALGGLTAFFHA